MSIVNFLSPTERRFLAQAVELAGAKQAQKDAEQSTYQQQKETQIQNKQREKQNLNLQLQVSPFSNNFNGLNETKPSDALARFSQQLRQEYESWVQVERTLEFPFVYRSEANKTLCFKMLRRIPVLQSLPENDLEVISSHMEIVQLRGKEIIAGKPPFTSNTHTSLPVPPSSSSSVYSFSEKQKQETVSRGQLASLGSLEESHTQGEETVKEPHETVASLVHFSSNFVYILLRGRVTLRIPTLASAMDAFVEPYEMFALPVTVGALPQGSRYETDGDCMLLRLTRDADLALDRVIGGLERRVVEGQLTFLRQQLRVRVFTHWTPQEFEACARAMVPMRVSWRQLIVEQGDKSDAMYFIKEGQCVVVRNVPLRRRYEQQKQKKEQERKQQESLERPTSPDTIYRWCSPGKEKGIDLYNSPTNFIIPLKQSNLLSSSTLPMKMVEVVTLREGEFFGEISLLNHSVDWKPDVNTIWSEKYWQKTLISALRAPVDFSALEGDASWRSSHETHSDDHNNESNTTENTGIFPLISLPRQATVYTKCPCILYMITHENCRQLFDGRVYAQFKEFAKGYPSCDNIEEQYERQCKWTRYRKDLVNEVMMDSSIIARKKPKLPPLQTR